MTYYHTPLRSSLPQQRWREEADFAARKRAAARAAAQMRPQVQQQMQQQAREREAANVARTAAAQLMTLRDEFAQQQDTLREAMVAYVVEEFEALSKELRIDAERQVKKRLAELERDFETKLAGLRMPRICGTHSESKIYLQHDLVAKNGGSYISRRDSPGVCPGPDWQQLTQPGKTGAKGERGFPGERGAKGESGATFIAWKIDKRNFVATPLISDGKIGPPLRLREFFEEFFVQTSEQK